MIVQEKLELQKIIDLAIQKFRIEEQIIQIIQEENPNFSRKKLVADLGEFYAKRNIEHFFEKLEFSKTRVSRCDLMGILKDEFATKWGLSKNVRIEVKTRYDQKGLPHLSHIDKNQFELLVFVSLNKNYSIHYIGMIKSCDLEVTNLKKVIFSSKLPTLFATEKEFKPIQ